MLSYTLEGNSIHMTEKRSLLSFDLRGKTVVVATHIVVEHMEQVREDLVAHVVTLPNGSFKVSGFVLGTVIDQSIHSQFWVEFPWSDSPIKVASENIIKVLLDDDAEPDTISGLMRLV